MTASQRSTPKRKRGSQNTLAGQPSTFQSSIGQSLVPRKKLKRKTNPDAAIRSSKKMKTKNESPSTVHRPLPSFLEKN
jgi:hypothetical protein